MLKVRPDLTLVQKKADLSAVYVNSTRLPTDNGSNVDIHLFDPATSARIVKSVTLSSLAQEKTARERDWVVSHLKEELGE
jgi:hypothetical protein